MPGTVAKKPVRKPERGGFTLAELLVGVTISAFIMTAVAIFMGSGIENAFRIKKSLERSDSGALFDSALAELQNFWGLPLHSGALAPPYGTGILLKNTDASAPLVLLSTRASTGVCDAFSGTVADPGEKDFLVIAKYFLAEAVQNDPPLALDHTGHVVRSGGSVVLGTGNEGTSGGNGTSAASTELRFPGAVSTYGAGFFTADTGNDRILFVSGGTASTLLSSRDGVRFPRSLTVVGNSLLMAEGDRILRMEDSLGAGTVFAASVTATGAFSFDSAEISSVPGSTGTFPSSTGSYAFVWTNPDSVSIMGNTGALSFPVTSVMAGSSMTFSIVSLTEPPLPGGYGMRIVLKNAGVAAFDRTFPYFTKGDGDLATMTGNIVSVVSDGLSFPYGIASDGTTWQSGVSDFSAFVATAPAAENIESDRIVENVALSSTGGILTVSYVEYVRYDCVGGRHTKRERILKIPLR